MSGGSWDYFCYKMEDVADRLCNEKQPERRALGRKMSSFAKAMHAIEWVDSSDSSPPEDTEAIKKALGKDADAMILSEIVTEAKAIKEQLEKYIKAAG